MQIIKLQSQPSHKAPEHDQSVNLSWNLSDDQKHRQMVALAKILMAIVAKKNRVVAKKAKNSKSDVQLCPVGGWE